jgi:putative hydrolase of the HAD superfamily
MASRSRINAVIFDLFGTLVPSFPPSGFHRSLEEMAAAVGLTTDEFVRGWTQDTSEDRHRGVFPTIEDNVRAICRAIGVTPEEAQVARAALIRTEFTRDVLKPRSDAIRTLERIRRRGLSTALVSVCSPEVPALWPETPFASVIDVPIFSCRVGLTKPDPGIFRLATDGLGVKPEHCVYVGDGYFGELSAAKGLRMKAVLLAPLGEADWDKQDSERESWKGKRIGRLSELLDLLPTS